MSVYLKKPRMPSRVIAETSAGIRLECAAMVRYADRARAVSYPTLGDDILASAFRLERLAVNLDTLLVVRPPAHGGDA